MRRVLRLTSDKPTRASISARCLLTAGVVMPSSRAAALRLPAPASTEKKPRSAGWTARVIFGAFIFEPSSVLRQARCSDDRLCNRRLMTDSL